MIAELKPYPAMKHSGVEWLGDVPEHWELRRLGDSVADCVNGVWGSEPNGVDDMPCVRVADFDRQRLRVRVHEPTIRAVSPNERRGRILKSGNLLLEKSGGGDQQPVGVVMLYDHDLPAVCSNFVARMPVNDGFDPGFLTFLHCALYAIRLNTRSIKQTTGLQNLDSSAYLAEPVSYPPLPEQTSIVRYLDYIDRRVRRYIRAKQKLTGLLEEQKQAIIHRAVTRGPDPDVPLKHSGVEWLGDVPEHWRVARFKSVAMVDGSLVDPRLPEHRDKILIAPNHIERGGTGRLLNSVTADSQGADSGKYCVRRGQIIYTKIRPYLRKAALAPVDCLCSADMYPISPRDPEVLSTRFLLVLMLSEPFTHYVVDCSLRAAMPKVNREALGDAVVWFPDLTEQLTILTTIATKTASLNAAMDRARRQIELVREYRARLIADVVTGKLDVREAAATLPDEPDEPEALHQTDALSAADEETEVVEELAE